MNKNVYSWIWKWHFLGGIISSPIIILLSVTGIIYLFKEDYEKTERTEIKQVQVGENPLSFQEQLEIAQANWDKKINAMILPDRRNEATEFVSGRFSHKSSIFIDPYTGHVNGKIQVNETDMHKVRKLHGELLLGAYGTKVVELIACWMIVLIITGIYLFWPRDKGLKGLFTVRTHLSKRILFRDLHAVSGFWFSILLLMLLAGGLPWTDVWGGGYKWVHDQTNTGLSKQWKGFVFKSEEHGKPIPLDRMVTKAQYLNLKGEVSIHIPQKPDGIYSISNQTPDVETMQRLHYDQYSGKELYSGTWDDVGALMQARLWIMAFHQGQFGTWNWILVLATAFGLLLISITALWSYLQRKRKNSWGIPATPDHYNVGVGIMVLIGLLSILLPLFGVSVLLILIIERVFNFKDTNKERL